MSDLIDDYQNGLVDLTDQYTDPIEAAYRRYADGDLDDDEAAAVITVAVLTAASRASALADLTASTWLTGMDRADVLPLGITTTVDAADVKALLDDRDGPGRLLSMLRARTYDAAAATWSTVIQTRAPLKRWTRRTENTNCKVCNGLANGHQLAMSTPMYRHTGCRCVQQPTEEGNTHA